MLKRLMYWLRGNKKCKSCCLLCKYYDQCREDMAGGVAMNVTEFFVFILMLLYVRNKVIQNSN